jgi:polysaccharide deacetylase 2 family uncharacterized protein YibQ
MAARRKKKSSQKKKKVARQSGNRTLRRLGLKLCIWLTALGLTALGLFGVLLVPDNNNQGIEQHVAHVPAQSKSAAVSAPPLESVPEQKKQTRVYEQVPGTAPELPQRKDTTSSPPQPAGPAQERAGPAKGPSLAVVIDDMGQSVQTARELLQIMGTDLTWAILPYSPDTSEVVALAAANNLEYLLHVPMEPQRYPQIDPGPGSIMVDMPPEQVRAVLINNLEQVPGAVGANNHMGSRFTEDVQGMRIVLQEITSRSLFFMDSLTSPKSKIEEVARDLRTPVAFRDVFLDNKQNVDAILRQLRKAEQVARRSGHAVAIGHPYPETLTALATWSKGRDLNVELVPLSLVVQKLAMNENEGQ